MRFFSGLVQVILKGVYWHQSVEQIAHQTGYPPTLVEEVLRFLADVNLVEVSGDGTTNFVDTEMAQNLYVEVGACL